MRDARDELKERFELGAASLGALVPLLADPRSGELAARSVTHMKRFAELVDGGLIRPQATPPLTTQEREMAQEQLDITHAMVKLFKLDNHDASRKVIELLEGVLEADNIASN